MTRIGPCPTRLICSPTVKSGTSNGDGSPANHSVAAPNTSAMNSCVPAREMPPAGWSSMPCPISWPMTSSAPSHWVATLRPSHCDSFRTSVCAPKSASSQPVSRLVALPLPHASSGPLNVVLFAESWQLRLVTVGSLMKNVPPDWTVLIVTGFGPFHPAVPLPCMTCSWVRRTAPVIASTFTLNRLTPSDPTPSTVDSQARQGVVPIASTTRRVPSTLVTVRSCRVATASASPWASVGAVDRLPIGRCRATELKTNWPALLSTRTKSPPTTGTPPYVRSYGTYWVDPDEITAPCVNLSFGLALR